MSTIILYDIASSSPNYSVSPMTWRIRYCLGIKGIPYKTEWVEYPDIQPLYHKLGITPTAKISDGSGPRYKYTLPVIYDSSTNKYIPDSFDIALYLEKQYPNTPSVFPNNTMGLHLAFADGMWGIVAPIVSLLTYNVFISLNPTSTEYYRKTREPGLGKKLEELVPTGSDMVEMDKLKGVLAKLETYYSRNGGRGPFLMGDIPSWSDVVVASILVMLRVAWGADSRQWKDAMNYPEGRWAVFMETIRNYE